MKKKMQEQIKIPEGITCTIANNIISCKNNSAELSRETKAPGLKFNIEKDSISISSEKGNKNHYNLIKTYIRHIKNLFSGLQEKYTYKLEACNIHFPITMKVDGKQLSVSNFLGEKTPRKAIILNNVDVQVKGHEITVSSQDKEAAGQTSANFEKMAKIKNRDRRVFQDGIYITQKPGEKKWEEDS